MSKKTEATNEKESLVITFCGAPNVGKSTLLNYLLGCKLSICSPKPQTTRENIKGILTEGNKQIVFVDTPGIFKPKQSQLEKQIVKEAWKGFCGSDLICLIIDAERGFEASAKMIINKTKENNIPAICVINKADLIKFDDKVLLAKQLWETGRFQEIFSLSAKTGKGCDKLLDYFFANTKEGNWLFEEDEITDKDNNFIASEFVREQLFLLLQKELPYMLSCETELFKENEDCVEISVVVKIGKQNHKKMIIGEGGKNLKKIIRKASVNLEKLIGKRVSLKIFIKLQERK